MTCGAGDSIFTQSAPGKRQKTAAERKAEKARKQAELEDVDPDQPWALEVVLLSAAPPSSRYGHSKSGLDCVVLRHLPPAAGGRSVS